MTASRPDSPTNGSTPQTSRQRVVAFLRDHPGQPWCAECVAARIERPRSRIANVFLAAEGMSGFGRRDELCVGCGRKRLALVFGPLRPSIGAG